MIDFSTEEKIIELINEKKLHQAREMMLDMNEVDIAELLEDVDNNNTVLLFRLLPKDLAAEIFAYFSREKQIDLINTITDADLKNIVEELYFDDMIDLVEEVPANVAKKVLLYSNAEERKLLNQFLNYPEDSAGSIMTIEYVNLRKDWTVGQAIERIRDIGITRETIYTCYVTENRVLKGIVSLRSLVTEDRSTLIEDIMETDVIFVSTHDDQEIVAGLFTRYGFLAVPVVDSEHRLIGIITVDDIMDVMEDEVTEDFQKLAATAPSEDPYMETSVAEHSKNRIIWLLILMISATVTGAIIAGYEEVLENTIILSSFIPMIMDTGGNAGSQSSTLIIRGLAIGEINLKDAGKVLWKELRVAIICGVILGGANFARLMILEKTGFPVAIAVSLTLLATVVMAKIIGGVLPIFAKKIKLDPAIMASSVVTTIVDAASLIVYFNIAKAFIKF